MEKRFFRYVVVAFLALIFALPFGTEASTGGFVSSSPGVAGGFSGPGQSIVTVNDAKSMRDDTAVRLRGTIASHLGKDKYLFHDSTGSIAVEIDHDKWGGQTISPADVVEIIGEVDRDWNSIEIDVDRVVKIQ